jgi:lantibiotic modifying enzyme
VPIPAAQGSGEQLETVLLTPEMNIPFAAGQDPTPEQFVEQMLEGFSQTWQFASTHRDAILEAMEAAPSQRIRYVVRDTVDYYQAIVSALYAGELDRVSLPPLPAAKAVFAALAPEERAALLQMDIPRFTLAAADTGLRFVAGCFPQSGYELARRGMERLGEKELAKQSSVIRVCWGLYGAAKSLA